MRALTVRILFLDNGVHLDLLLHKEQTDHAREVGSIFTAIYNTEDDNDGDDDDNNERATFRDAARGCAAAAVWHSNVASSHQFEALEADAVALVRAVGTQPFWIDGVDSPSCTLERLVLEVHRFHEARAGGSFGVEWWVQVKRSASVSKPADRIIGLHFDSDEEHKRQTGVHMPPWLSTVTYLSGSHGASTLLLPAVADSSGRAVPITLATRSKCPPAALAVGLDSAPLSASDLGQGAYLCRPEVGKHLAFDGRLLHGALYELTDTSDDINAVRATLVVNLWSGHRPSEAVRLPSMLAGTLSNLHIGGFERARSVAPSCVVPKSVPWARLDWRIRAIGTIPPTAAIKANPGWRRLGIGLPFFHPKIALRNLPHVRSTATTGDESHKLTPSFVYAPEAELCLTASLVMAMSGPIPSFEGCRVHGPNTQHLWSNM